MILHLLNLNLHTSALTNHFRQHFNGFVEGYIALAVCVQNAPRIVGVVSTFVTGSGSQLLMKSVEFVAEKSIVNHRTILA